MEKVDSSRQQVLDGKKIDAEVVVVGAGPAGIAAALASARRGAKTILVERYGFIGGNLSMWLPLLGFHDIKGNKLIEGIAEEIVDRLRQIDGAIGPILCPLQCSYVIIDVEKLKSMCFELLKEAGVRILLHSVATGTLTEEGTVKRITIQTKQGIQEIEGKVFIDASGDGDIAAAAGATFKKGREEDGGLQPPTLMFRMGGVDTDKVRRVITDPSSHHETMIPPSHFSKNKYYIFVGFRDLIAKAKKEGALPADHPMNVVLFITLPRRGEVAVNMAKVTGIDATKAEDLTRCEIEAREQVPILVDFFRDYVPGFESAYLMDTAHEVGLRETRRIMGDYILGHEDVVEGKRPPDTIALGGYMVDVHPPEGGDVDVHYPKRGYGIPYRCLLPKDLERLLVAGRCISATHKALGSTRVMVICMAIGEAAGAAAALAVKGDVTPREIKIELLQKSLVQEGAYLG